MMNTPYEDPPPARLFHTERVDFQPHVSLTFDGKGGLHTDIVYLVMLFFQTYFVSLS